jgi:C4-dicarboxylate transporter/malic acid transport protein
MTGFTISGFIKIIKPLSYLDHPREMIRQFTPNWFAVTMGTGILALVLPQVSGAGALLHDIGEGLWLFNIFLFVVFSLLYAARWILFWNEAKKIFSHSIVSMFIGTIPMGLATIINGFIYFGLPRWGSDITFVVQWLWIIDVIFSLGCAVLIPYFMFTRQEHEIDKMTAVWLLPIVAAEVAAVSGAQLVPHLYNTQTQYWILIASYILWAYSVPIAFGILTILFLRMALHRLPPNSMAASSWLSIGPIGTGALGMLLLGADAPAIFASQGMVGIGKIAEGFGLIVGTLLWGAGMWWLLLAMLITIRYFRTGVPFNLGWWGYIFPLGVYAVATLKLGVLLKITAFSIFGTGLVVILAGMWFFVMLLTIYEGWRGRLFFSPCIANVN